VLCLECGSWYAKPVGGGTAQANPGCPDCGYLGWVPFNREESPQLRSAEDPPRRRSA
jgi:predicted  nucleic acid-binding Zn-ribbon protein